jgi:hypothetical protein
MNLSDLPVDLLTHAEYTLWELAIACCNSKGYLPDDQLTDKKRSSRSLAMNLFLVFIDYHQNLPPIMRLLNPLHRVPFLDYLRAQDEHQDHGHEHQCIGPRRVYSEASSSQGSITAFSKTTIFRRLFKW